MMMNNKEMQKQLESLNSLRNKLNSELDIEKKRTAKFIKNFKKDDLLKHKTEICKELETEIVSRYYFQK